MIEIVSKKIKEQSHWHVCPRCKKPRLETNYVCGMSSGDHRFVCLVCLQDVRLRLGTDIVIDTYLDQTQAERLQEVAPDEKANLLDQLDSFLKQIQQEQLAAKQKARAGVPPEVIAKVDEDKIKAHDLEMERMNDEAEKLTWDEAKAELEQIEKEEKI